jgi:hypothetical protein
MALKFGDSKGGAIRDKAPTHDPKEGENRFRMVGDLLARYVYWLKGENGKPIPFECLAFNRETEKFDNAEKDWVSEYRPDLKCGWAYAIQGFEPGSDELKVWNLKKKLFGAIITAAEDLGDPTDPDTGWEVVYTKKKTGPLPINVEYSLNVLRCKPKPLTEAQKEAIENGKPIDEIMKRPTPDQQKQLLDKLNSGTTENVDEAVDEEFAVK